MSLSGQISFSNLLWEFLLLAQGMKRSHRRAASRKGQHFRQRWGKGSQAGNGMSAVCTRPDESTHLDRMQRDAGQGARPPLLGACLPAKSLQSCPTLCDPMDCSRPGSLSKGFSRQEYWSGLPCPPPGGLPTHGSNLHLLSPLHWQVGSLPLAPPGKPH